MAKQSTSGSPAFKAVSYKAPEPVSAARRAAIYESFPVPVYLVMRTDWRLPKRSGKHPQQTTTVVSAFTTLLSAQEAALIGFERFVQEYHYAGERSVENRFSWYSRLHGKNKAYRDVKEIADDMKTWQTKWKGTTTEERYEKMLVAMEAVKPRLPSGSIFNVENAGLPPAARARAVNPIDPVPFRIFVLTQNHWSWSKSVDDTTILGVFTCLNQARVEGVDAYHAYIHSSDQERKRLKWDKTADNAYDKMLNNVIADKLAWEKTSREYGTSFSIDECYCYPRGAYFRHEDEVLPKVQEDPVLPRSVDSSMRNTPSAEKLPSATPIPAPTAVPAAPFPQSVTNPVEQVSRSNASPSTPPQSSQRGTNQVEQVPRAYVPSSAPPQFRQRVTKPAEQVPPANVSSPPPPPIVDKFSQHVTKPVEQVPRANVSSPAPPPIVEKEKMHAPVVKNTDEDGPRAHGFIRRTYAVNPEKKEGDFGKPGSNGAAGKKGILSSIRGSHHLRGLDMGRVRFYDRRKKDERDQAGGDRSTRFGSRQGKVDPEAEERERHGEIQGEEDGGPKRRKTWSDQESEKNGEDPSSVSQKEDVAEAWAQARARARARRAHAEDKERGGDPDKRDLQGKKNFEDVRTNIEITAPSENVVYHRAYGYVAGDQSRRNFQHERQGELTSEGERADDEVSVQTAIRRNVNQRRRVDEEVGVQFASEVHKFSNPAKKSGREDIHGSRSQLPVKGSETAWKSKDNYSPFDDVLDKEKTDEEIGGGDYNPFDDPPEIKGRNGERNPEGYRNPFDDSETEKRSELERSNGNHDMDEMDDPPLVRKPRKPDEKISKYLEDQLNCLFSRKDREDEVPSDDHGCQTESDPVLGSGRRKEFHSGKTRDSQERPDLNRFEEEKGHSSSDDHRQNNGAGARKAADLRDVPSEQVKHHRGYSFSNVVYEEANHADADDPPLIRKSRQRKGDDRCSGETSRRETHRPTDTHFASGGPKEMNFIDGEYIPKKKKSGEKKESWSRDDGLRADSWRRDNSQQAGIFADCEIDQLEESSVEEQQAGPRREAPHLDLALKRHRASMRKTEEVSEEEFGCGRRPLDGGFKFGLIGRMRKIINRVTTIPEDWSD
ncbi:hypothetical protein R1flu_015560 [Riccia fluitans]|uniref:Uncharacterized protein n=1 Tax=Riccia fluitans TaxID=41844 RepID=A0ABD1YJB0_9MARC